MTPALTPNQHPRCPSTGLTLPLSKSLASQDLAKHRAVIAVELEVLAKKFDRFGWERDRGTAAHDRLITDWMNALQDFPLQEIREACAGVVLDNPGKMPNEGHIRAAIIKARGAFVARSRSGDPINRDEGRAKVSASAVERILAEAGFSPKRFDEVETNQ